MKKKGGRKRKDFFCKVRIPCISPKLVTQFTTFVVFSIRLKHRNKLVSGQRENERKIGEGREGRKRE